MGSDKERRRPGDLAEAVGRNLRGLRVQRDLTLEGLARISGVSRAMLWQIERARSAPTITVLSRVADALGVPISAFLNGTAKHNAVVVLRRGDSRILQAEDGAVSARALFPVTGTRNVEFHEVRLRAGAVESIMGRRDGTYENLVVSEGAVEVEVGAEVHLLCAGDALFFRADVPHCYRNKTQVQALLYRVAIYPSAVNYD